MVTLAVPVVLGGTGVCGDTFKGLITLKVKNKNIVDKLMTRLKKIKGVDKVLRF